MLAIGATLNSQLPEATFQNSQNDIISVIELSFYQQTCI
jgi:hypothetical protein